MHPALPTSLTIENLAAWLTETRIDTQKAKVTTVISREERSEYEHISSECSQKMDILNEIKEKFNDHLNNGTYDPEVDEENGAVHTIPATVGIKKLKAERERVDKICRDGHTIEETILYMIPWPEEKRIIAFDILGQEFEDYSRDMREDEITKYRTLFDPEMAPMAVEQGGDAEMPAEEIPMEEPKPTRRKRGSAGEDLGL